MNKMIYLAGALLLASCGGQPKSTSSLNNTDWVLTGFESATGISNAPNRYFTLSFSADAKLGGTIESCRFYTGEYTQTDALIDIKNVKDEIVQNCSKELQDADYIAQLNSVKTFTTSSSPDTLKLNLLDGRRLNFSRKFAVCANSKAVTGNNTGKVEITTASQPIGDLIAHYEETKPDFVIVSAGSCTNSVIASVNPDTLADLRCNNAVTSLVYK
ncbi:MAG: META domain-containing protein [Moraxellaceae bacterium]|nr:MAG: META domain-containing protein [Moraxellaceae bacterium]